MLRSSLLIVSVLVTTGGPSRRAERCDGDAASPHAGCARAAGERARRRAARFVFSPPMASRRPADGAVAADTGTRRRWRLAPRCECAFVKCSART